MKATFSLAAVLLLAAPIAAAPTSSNINGVIYSTVGDRGLDERAVCNHDNVLRDLLNTQVAAQASVFCSAYLQSTITVTATATLSETNTASVTDTLIVTATTTVIDDVATTTILCPASPTATLTTCNYPAYGFSTYLISQNPNTDPYTCHELCLADPNCQSFQIQAGGQMYCNLYNVPTYNNVEYAPGDVFTFFDRDCTQYTSGDCGSSPDKREIHQEKREQLPNPTYIPATVPPSRVSSACSCFITSPSAPATATVTATTTNINTVTITTFATATAEDVVVESVTTTAIVTAPPK
ncbi:MAG: hypothetical protein MMC33_010432 [Icmadophila ericetorum]|nr:hypothetical protein [Icmadophila ericetorum]